MHRRLFIAAALIALSVGIALGAERSPEAIFGDVASGEQMTSNAVPDFERLVNRHDYPADQEQLAQLLDFCRDHVGRFLAGNIPSSEHRWMPRSVSIALGPLRRYPAPESAPIAREILRIAPKPGKDRSVRGARMKSLAILASLQDSSIRPELERMVVEDDDPRGAIRFLVDLGDPLSIPILEAVAADSSLADTLCARRKRVADDPSRVELKQFMRPASQIRIAANRAARDIRLYQRGIVVPFELSDQHVDRLLDQGFTVMPETTNELYGGIKAEYPFVTSDVVWRTFMILMRGTWDDLEPLVIAPDMKAWLSSLLDASVRQAQAEVDTELGQLAWNNVVRIMVAMRLLDETASAPMPAHEMALVEAEVDRIVTAEGLLFSDVLGHEEDYPSYRPNGRHTASPEAEQWFRAVRWLGRSTWRFFSKDGVRQTLLMADLMQSSPDLFDRWNQLEALMARWLGRSDDITIGQVLATVPEPRRALESADELAAAATALRSLSLPAINSLPDAADPEQGQGMRLLGARYSATSEAMQEQLDDGVWPPSAVEILSGLLERFDEVDPASEPLPAAGMACLAALHHGDPRVPSFMSTDAWAHKQMNTSLAGWAEIQHALAPYLKTAVEYKGLSRLSDRFHGYVEPSVGFYERLLDLVRRSIADLENCDFFERLAADIPTQTLHEWRKEHRTSDAMRGPEKLSEYYRAEKAFWTRLIRPDRARWRDLETLLTQLADLSRRELAGEPQTIADCILMRHLNVRLQNLSLTASNLPITDKALGFATEIALNRNGPNEALMLAVGRPLTALAAIPDGAGRVYVCRGPVYAVHEFVTDADSRVTDDEWRDADTFPASGSRVPWIFNHADLGWEREFSAAELRDLTLSYDRGSSFSLSVSGFDRWRRHLNTLSDVRVPPELVDLLVEVAIHPHVGRNDRMHLLSEAARLTGPFVTVDHWESMLDIAEQELDEDQQRYTWSRCELIIYWSLRALPNFSDSEAATERARGLLARLSRSDQKRMMELLAGQ